MCAKSVRHLILQSPLGCIQHCCSHGQSALLASSQLQQSNTQSKSRPGLLDAAVPSAMLCTPLSVQLMLS